MTTAEYNKSVHRVGRIWMISAFVMIVAVPVLISAAMNCWPPIKMILAGYLPIVMLYGPVGVIEVATYGPMLGNGGTYLGFVSGNLANLKVPCALNAMTATDYKPGTEEGEIISTVSVAISSIVTTIMLFIGVVGFSFIMPVLNSPTLAPAFANILPALFGGLAVVYISRNPKISAVPILVMLTLFLIYPSLPVGILIPLGAVIAIGTARILYKKGKV